jgi:hypothetical protein
MSEDVVLAAKMAHAQGRFADAEHAYRTALAANPNDAHARFNLSVLLLRQGRYAEGWTLYEARFAAGLKEPAPTRSKNFALGRWTGQDLTGRTLMLWPEQGFGDYIMVIRYAPLLKRMGLAKLTVVCAPPLVDLFKTVAGIDAILSAGEQVAPHDYWLPAMSLPLRFATTLETVPASLPYLHADPARVDQWAQRIKVDGLKVGLVWKGSPEHTVDAQRSLPHLNTLLPLQLDGVRFFSLQKGELENEVFDSPLPIEPLGVAIKDFADAAAAIACLDLLICVDTAYAHLAGAMGRECWVLAHSHAGEWRWLEDRTDSPWYPGAIRLFRKGSAPTWDDAIADVARELAQKKKKPPDLSARGG